jgi:DNA-binding transcriptional regulator YdaS (Cro superfamily)
VASVPAPGIVPDPFRAWLAAQKQVLGAGGLAERLGVTPQTVNNWLRGKTVARHRVKALQLEAALDGVILTTEQLLGVATHP